MFDFFKKKPVAGGKEAAGKPEIQPGALCRLMRLFPIGTKVRFYPEYRKEIMLDSVIIGYVINSELVYSVQGLVCDKDSGPMAFSDQTKLHSYSRIQSFRIVVPATNQSEAKLDYNRREELHKIGGLTPGNTITLISERQGQHVPVLETTVQKRALLNQGYYAGVTVAMLDVNIGTLKLTDQRAHVRLQTNMPVSVQYYDGPNSNLVNCTMLDFSECSLRLKFGGDFPAESMPHADDDLILSFHLPDRAGNLSLVGHVFRIEGDAVVVMLKGSLGNNQAVAPLSPIDILEIKANLLQNGRARPVPAPN
ncbi:MAG: PilZ domain-containing protein [Gammaproteobacteria bacterium]|nr:PilZ domain-containing protein [Gammaproteobacteria bacterium]